MTPLSDAVPRPPGLRRRARGPRRRRLHDAQDPDRPARSSSRAARGVLRIAFEGEPLDRTLAGVAAGVGPRIVQSDRELAATRDTLSDYLEGDDDTLELPVDLSLVGGPFRRAVLETLHREVRRGEVVTYGALAAPGRQPARRPRGRHRLRRATRSRSSYPATACCPPRGDSATTAAGRSASARCSRSRARPGRPEPLPRSCCACRRRARRSWPPRSARCRSGCSGSRSCCSPARRPARSPTAGRVVAAFGLANALGAVAQGRLMDRLGQTRVLRAAARRPRRRARRARARARRRKRSALVLVGVRGCGPAPRCPQLPAADALAVGHAGGRSPSAAAPPTRSSRSCSRWR